MRRCGRTWIVVILTAMLLGSGSFGHISQVTAEDAESTTQADEPEIVEPTLPPDPATEPPAEPEPTEPLVTDPIPDNDAADPEETEQPTDTPEPTGPAAVPDILSCLPQGPNTAYAGTTITFRCDLTLGSDRTATVIEADISTAHGGWLVHLASPAPGGNLAQTEPGLTARETLTIVQEHGDSLWFDVVLHTPARVDSEIPVSVTIRTGIATVAHPNPALDGPFVNVNASAIPYPPNVLTCAAEPGEIDPGATSETICTYTVNGPSDGASVTAALTSVPGEGWTVELVAGGTASTPGETTTWSTGESLARDTAFDLVVRISAPADAEPGQQATLALTRDDAPDAVATWSVPVSDPPMMQRMMIVEPGDGELTCEAVSAGPRVSPSVVEYACTWGGHQNDDEFGDVKATIDDGAFEDGWGVSLEDEEDPSGVFDQLEDIEGGPGGGAEFSVWINIPAGQNTGVSATTEVIASCGDDSEGCESGSVTIVTTVDQVVEQTDVVAIGCVPQSGAYTITVPVGESTFVCTIRAYAEEVELDELSVSAAGNSSGDLSASFEDPLPNGLEGEDGVLVPVTGPFLLPSGDDLPTEFTFTVNVTDGDIDDEQYLITVAADIGDEDNPELTFVIAAQQTQQEFCAPSANIAGNDPLSFDDSTWNGDGWTEATGTLTLDIGLNNPDECEGFAGNWNVEVTAFDMGRPGGGTIPASAISYTGTASGGSEPDGLDPAEGVQLSESGVPIATMSETDDFVGGSWEVGFTIDPSSGVDGDNHPPPGTYTGTIIITTSESGG